MRGFQLANVAMLVLLAACAPQRLQSVQLTEGSKGQEAYQMTGYTDLGEIAPDSSIHHIEEALSDACPIGVRVEKLRETETHNGFGSFLHWNATAVCR